MKWPIVRCRYPHVQMRLPLLIPDRADGIYRFEHVKVSLIEMFSNAKKALWDCIHSLNRASISLAGKCRFDMLESLTTVS
jgi:hypothetical protein